MSIRSRRKKRRLRSDPAMLMRGIHFQLYELGFDYYHEHDFEIDAYPNPKKPLVKIFVL